MSSDASTSSASAARRELVVAMRHLRLADGTCASAPSLRMPLPLRAWQERRVALEPFASPFVDRASGIPELRVDVRGRVLRPDTEHLCCAS